MVHHTRAYYLQCLWLPSQTNSNQESNRFILLYTWNWMTEILSTYTLTELVAWNVVVATANLVAITEWYHWVAEILSTYTYRTRIEVVTTEFSRCNLFLNANRLWQPYSQLFMFSVIFVASTLKFGCVDVHFRLQTSLISEETSSNSCCNKVWFR